MIAVFQRQLCSGWVYPCTEEDIRQKLTQIPSEDLEGLAAIGLVPELFNSRHNYGTYYWENKYECRPTIHIPAWREHLSFKQKPQVSRGEVYAFCAVELSYGMQLTQTGDRWLCQWCKESSRAFIRDHVLLHEVGHHACHLKRLRQGLNACPGTRVCEQYAEDYALRLSRTASHLTRSSPLRNHCPTWPHGARLPHMPQQGCRRSPAQRAGLKR